MMNKYLYSKNNQVLLYKGNNVDVLKTLPEESINCVVTSPPYYGLRDYGGEDEQLGLEATPKEYVENMVQVFREVKRVLAKDGTLWLNLGDSYAGSNSDKHSNPSQNTLSAKMGQTYGGIEKPIKAKVPGLKPKDLMGIPWKVAFALQDDGWYLRQDIIWHKPAPMPESVKDRCTKSHEYIFLLSKSAKYYYDIDAIREPIQDSTMRKLKSDLDLRDQRGGNLKRKSSVEQKMESETGINAGNYLETILQTAEKGRNKRSVWSINTASYKDSHFAVFPKELPMTCIKAGTREGDVVLDPFAGSGTTLMVAQELGRKAIGIDIKSEYLDMCLERTKQMGLF